MQSLLSINKGEHCRIQDMELPSQTTKRLFELGLHTGAQVTMKKNNVGPCILGIHHSTIALDRNLCRNIFVVREHVAPFPDHTTKKDIV